MPESGPRRTKPGTPDDVYKRALKVQGGRSKEGQLQVFRRSNEGVQEGQFTGLPCRKTLGENHSHCFNLAAITRPN
jgi:hypothetical protein